MKVAIFLIVVVAEKSQGTLYARPIHAHSCISKSYQNNDNDNKGKQTLLQLNLTHVRGRLKFLWQKESLF